MTDSERQQILKMIEDGKITAEQGLSLMQALDTPADDAEMELAEENPEFYSEMSDETAEAFRSTSNEHPEFAERVKRYRRLWLIPLGVGLLITLGSASWMNAILQSRGVGGWFIFATLIFLFGVTVTAFGASSRTSRWIYVNVQEKPGSSPQHIVIAFPFPAGLVRWAVSSFGHHIPDRERKIADDVLKSIFESSALDEPLFVDVKEEDGEHVQVYIG